MAKAAIKLRLFNDENAPDSVARYLRRRGHSVHRAKGQLADGTPDPVVATFAMEDDRILISQDKDFNSQRFMQPRYGKLSRIALVGDGPTLLPAVKEHVHLIEAQWAACVANGTRMTVHIQVGQIRIRTYPLT